MARTRCCRTACYLIAKAYFIGCLCQFVAFLNLDNWVWEPDATCQGVAQPVNRSGVRVLVHGMAKTGTKSMAKALHHLGYATYHSEDFFTNVWTGIADEHWRRPENGCRRFGGMCPWSANKSEAGLVVLNHTAPERLAKEISRCGVEAMAFDGIDHLWWPIYDASPDAKVVSMSWRTYKEYRKSRDEFSWQLLTVYWFYGMLVGSQMLLPYNAVIIPLLEHVSGGEMSRWLTTGQPAPTLAFEGPARKYFRQAVGWRRWYLHMIGGLEVWYNTQAEYEAFFEDARRRIPPERFFEWDMRRHTMKDLCKFLGITQHPECQVPGALPKVPNLLYIERLAPLSTLALVPLYVFLHFLNWQLLNFCCGVCNCCPCFFESRRRRAKVE